MLGLGLGFGFGFGFSYLRAPCWHEVFRSTRQGSCGTPFARDRAVVRTRRMAAASDADSTWAELGDLVDPITLEPLSSLSCPPFELRANAKQRSASDWSAKRLTLAFNLSLSHSLSLSLSPSASHSHSLSLSLSHGLTLSLRIHFTGSTDARLPCISSRAAASRTRSLGASSIGTRSPRSTRTCTAIRTTTASPRRRASSTGWPRRAERALRCPRRRAARWPGRWRRRAESSLLSSARSSTPRHTPHARTGAWPRHSPHVRTRRRAAGGVAARRVTRRDWRATRTSSCAARWRPRSATRDQHGAAKRVPRRAASRLAARRLARRRVRGRVRRARRLRFGGRARAGAASPWWTTTCCPHTPHARGCLRRSRRTRRQGASIQPTPRTPTHTLAGGLALALVLALA